MKSNRIEKNTVSSTLNLVQSAFTICCISVIILVSTSTLAAQEPLSGGSHPEKRESGNTPDKNLRSLAKVNPSTLALEMSLPLMSYPGRNGNSLSVDFRYSSKVWRLKDVNSWITNSGSYMTDVYPLYAERSAGGWTSSLVPPRIDEEQVIYNAAGYPYAASVEDLTHTFEVFLGSPSSFEHQYLCTSVTIDGEPAGEPECVGYVEYEAGVAGSLPPGMGDPVRLLYVKRWRVVMPDGSSHEFRKDDKLAPLVAGSFQTPGSSPTPTPVNLDGEFLAVDGSGMTLNRDANGFVLRLPNGGFYQFPNEAQSEDGLYATAFTDVNGNRMTYHEPENSPGHEQIMDGYFRATNQRSDSA